MRYRYCFAVFLLILFSAVLQNVAIAQEEECKQVCTSKKFYEEGDNITIYGKVDAVLANTPIIIQIFRNQTLVDVAQEDVAADGSYSVTFKAEGAFWKTSGTYTARATYGTTTNVYETNFDYQTKAAARETTDIFEVDAGDSGTFDVPYTIKGGTVTNILVDQDILGLIVTIDSQTDGQIVLDLQRKWIDAKKIDGADDTYIILIDGLEVPYQETTNANSRVLTIQFQQGDSDIEIIGTYVVPEFGAVAAVVLMVAIASMLVISKKTLLVKLN